MQLHHVSAEDSLKVFLQVLWLHLVKYIPRRKIETVKRTHGWLNEKSKAAIASKNNAEGTIRFADESAKCAKILAEEKARHVEHVKEKLAKLPRRNKQW